LLSGPGGCRGEFRHQIPGHEFLNAVDGMVGDGGQHIAEMGIEIVEIGGADQAVDRGGALAAGIGACRQTVLAAQSYSG